MCVYVSVCLPQSIYISFYQTFGEIREEKKRKWRIVEIEGAPLLICNRHMPVHTHTYTHAHAHTHTHMQIWYAPRSAAVFWSEIWKNISHWKEQPLCLNLTTILIWKERRSWEMTRLAVNARRRETKPHPHWRRKDRFPTVIIMVTGMSLAGTELILQLFRRESSF